MNLCIKETMNIFVIWISCWTVFKIQYSSALVDLEPILNTEREIAKSLEKYLDQEQKRLDKIKRYKDEYNKMYSSATRDVDTFLSNPVNAFVMVKRLTMDWKNVLTLMDINTSKDIIKNVAEKEVFPNPEDIDESAAVVLRLQEVYLLNTTQLSQGEIPEMKGTAELTASDCLELGLQSYKQENFDQSLLWMEESSNRLENDKLQTVNKSVLFEHMALCAYSLGHMEKALKLTKDLKSVDPEHEHVNKNMEIYEKAVREKSEKKNIKSVSETENSTVIEEAVDHTKYFDYEIYKKLCRGERLKSPEEESRLKCRYTTGNSKYLLLQPVKEETLNLEPWIVMYHDVIRDRDIELLKELAGPKLERSAVQSSDTGMAYYSKNRISKYGWLEDTDHPRLAKISQYLEEITGLESDTAEDFQINKYEQGGHQKTHYDFIPEMKNDFFGMRNRIATWLFYLSDVDAGGSTVFMDVDVQAKPEKGSAAFWFNLYKNGNGDFRTKHAACPVLAGTKWVTNKWFHEKDQEFRRPCSLNPLE